MNQTFNSLMSNFELDAINECVDDLTSDPNLSVSIGYVHVTAATTNLANGLQVRTENTDTITVIRRVMTESDLHTAPGFVQVGDILFLIDAADLTSDPTTKDRITEGAKKFEVISFESDPPETAWRLIAREI